MPDTVISDDLIPPSFIYDSQHTSPVREASQSDDQSHHDSSKRSSNGRRRKHHRYRRERELAQKSHAELVRLIVFQEKETEKLQRTLAATLQLLQQERERLAKYDDEMKNIVQRSRTFNENLEKARVEENEAMRQLRLVQFRLDNAEQDIIRLQEELELARRQKVQAEEEAVRARTQAWDHRRRRLIEAAREEGRRAGFEDGFKRAQVESPLHQRVDPLPGTPLLAPTSTIVKNVSSQHRQNAAHSREEDADDTYDELSSISVIDPPRGNNPPAMPPGVTVGSLKTRGGIAKIPDRNISTPAVDSYSVPVPPADAPRDHPPQHEWVTGLQHRQLTGQNPPRPSTLLNPNPRHSQPSFVPQSVSSDENVVRQMPRSGRSGAKFTGSHVRRPSLATKTKEKAASWYRSLSFRKKQKQKPLIDPIQEEDIHPPHEATTQTAPTDSNFLPSTEENATRETEQTQQAQEPLEQYRPDTSQQERAERTSARQSKVGSVSTAGVRVKDFAYAPNPRNTISTHISDYELLSAPGGSQTRIRQPGSAANSITGRSTKSAKPSVRAPHSGKLQPNRELGSGRTRFFETGSIAGTMNDEKRSVRSRRSGRMIAVNPDPPAEDDSNEVSVDVANIATDNGTPYRRASTFASQGKGKQRAPQSPYPQYNGFPPGAEENMAYSSPLNRSPANRISIPLQHQSTPLVDYLHPSAERFPPERNSLSNRNSPNSRSPRLPDAIPRGMPKIFQAQGPSQNPGSHRQSMSENRAHSRSASDSATTLLRQGHNNPDMNATDFLTLTGGIHRSASNTSLRSQGSFGKFDPSTYMDPAIWAAPPGAFAKVNSNGAGPSKSIRSKPSFTSSHLSYASK